MICNWDFIMYLKPTFELWLVKPTGSSFPKSPARGRTSSPYLISQKKNSRGRLQTHTVQTDDKKHSPSALLVCDTRADNAGSACSGSGGRYLLFHSLLRKALLWTLAPLPVSFCPPLCLSSVFNWTFLLFSRMSRAIGSHLLVVRLWVVGQINIEWSSSNK